MAERKVNRKPQGGLQQFLAKGGIDIPFFALLIAIIVIGLVMLFSSTYVTAYYYEKYNHDPAYFFKRQLIWVLLGSVVMFAISHIELERFKFLFAVVGTAASWFFLGLALIMPAHNGTKRHVYLPGGIQFQPSDVAKFALILTLAALLSEFHSVIVNKNPLQSSWARKVNDFVNRPLMNKSMFIILICGGLILVYAALVAAGSHLSGTILILVIGVSMLYLGEVRLKWFLGGAVGATAAFMVLNKLGVLKSYMEERIIAWQDKSYEPLGARWQINQALYAIGSGGFMGKGLGQSTLKHLYVSEPQNDMIFSIVVEELGFVGAAIILILFALLIWRGIVIGINNPSRYKALVAMGIVVQLGVQVVLNILVTTDTIPNTGISLPFFSYGGTAYLITMAEMGFVLSISRSSRLRRQK